MEKFFDCQSQNFNLTSGEIEFNEPDKHERRVWYIRIAGELRKNAWKLVDLLDWKGTPGAKGAKEIVFRREKTK